jgi:hypothetical protein
VKVCGPGAFVVLKALAFTSRGENKDAYDLYYLVRNYGTGPEDVAKQLLSLGEDPQCREAIDIVRRDFLDVRSVGVMRATAFIRGDGILDDDVQAGHRGLLRTLHRSLRRHPVSRHDEIRWRNYGAMAC